MDEQGVGGGTPPTDGGGRNDGTAPGARHGRTRRAVLIGTGAAAAGVIGWGISRLSDEDDSKPSEESTTPMPKGPCLVEREFPDSFSSSLEVLDAAPLEATVLGTPFTQVSLQDVIALMGTDERERLVITQHGATAQIQLVPLDGDSEPVVHDVAVGVNPGVAQGAGVVWFVTREDGRVLSVGPDPDVMTDRGRVSEEATSLYSPVIGPGGEVFGGSYPIGAVWRLDPATDEISVGPGIDGNRYVRSLAVVGDRLFAGTGGDSPGLYEIDQGTLEPIASYAVPGVRSGCSVSRRWLCPGGTLLVYRDEEDGGADGVIFSPESGVFDDELSPGASSRRSHRISTGDGVFFVAADRVQWLDASTLEVRDAGGVADRESDGRGGARERHRRSGGPRRARERSDDSRSPQRERRSARASRHAERARHHLGHPARRHTADRDRRLSGGWCGRRGKGRERGRTDRGRQRGAAGRRRGRERRGQVPGGLLRRGARALGDRASRTRSS